ncbi:NAD(P)/FAD-dependent oxidoreductase [Cryobacterium sp. BB736]|uniref:NAD(P)/FAD-dependent oxidoreductase n=1 Tax=Cryobacterium sp. BB736 TaxID=2746963 RepID=UPI001873F26C|nr:NAD(P)/FAD-dependent oxidoreductase [Cryobacterium sp. BB736]
MTQLLVAGGGPIGLAAAIEARLAGLDVAVIEQRHGTIDKACGEGLMPGALRALNRLGVDPVGRDIRGISYRRDGHRADHPFAHGTARGVRRPVLHDALSRRADELGVERIEGKVGLLSQDDESVTVVLRDEAVRANWLIGCDGLHSTVRDLVGLASPPRGRRRFGLRRHFAIEPWSDFVEVHWTKDAEVYVTPVGDHNVGIAVLGAPGTDYDRTVSTALADRIDGAPHSSDLRGAGPLRQRTRARTAGRVLLAGDASGYVDALTGEGIRVGLAQVAAAVRCIVAGDPQAYEREWRTATRDFRMLTSGLVALGASPARRAIVPLADSLPRTYGAIVERLAR